jgi:hypothetical protein
MVRTPIYMQVIKFLKNTGNIDNIRPLAKLKKSLQFRLGGLKLPQYTPKNSSTNFLDVFIFQKLMKIRQKVQKVKI